MVCVAVTGSARRRATEVCPAQGFVLLVGQGVVRIGRSPLVVDAPVAEHQHGFVVLERGFGMSTVVDVQDGPGGRSPKSVRGNRRGLLAVVAVLVVALVGVVVWFVVSRGDSDPEFDFSKNRMCDWVTAEEMNDILATAQDRAGTSFVFPSFTDADCSMDDPGGAVEWRAVVPSGEEEPGLYVQLSLADDSFRDPERMSEPSAFVGHELLDESVSYGNLSDRFVYSEGMSVDLSVEGHEGEVLSFALAGGLLSGGPYDSRPWELLGLAVADAMLREMNWVG